MRQSNKNSQKGFTLVELLVTIAILAIIAAFAAPNVKNAIVQKRIEKTTMSVVTLLQEGKAESALRRKGIVFEYDNNAETLRLTDPTANGPSGNTNISFYRLDSATADIVMNQNRELTFHPNGTMTIQANSGQSAGAFPVTFQVCDNKASGENGRLISINAMALITVGMMSGNCT